MVALRSGCVWALDSNSIVDIGITPNLLIFVSGFLPSGFTAFQLRRPQFDVQCIVSIVNEENLGLPILVHIDHNWSRSNIARLANVDFPCNFCVIACRQTQVGVGCLSVHENSKQIPFCTSFNSSLCCSDTVRKISNDRSIEVASIIQGLPVDTRFFDGSKDGEVFD